MKYRDLKNERDDALKRAVEAERMSMKSEFDRVVAEFEREKARILAESEEKILSSYYLGFAQGSEATAAEFAMAFTEVRLPASPPEPLLIHEARDQ